MSVAPKSFSDNFFHLTGHSPMRWQHRLFDQFIDGKIPAPLDLPTGLGKTSVMAIWVLDGLWSIRRQRKPRGCVPRWKVTQDI
jgi:CRISPR/Cas system-associated endonuclease/helicase Cas3